MDAAESRGHGRHVKISQAALRLVEPYGSERRPSSLPLSEKQVVVRPVMWRRPGGGAFTLLEILMVLAVIALLLGVVVPLTSGFSREGEFRDVVRGLLVLAKTARTDAMTSGHAAEVIFEKRAFALRRAGEEEASETVQIPRDMQYTIRPFGADKVLRPDAQRWIFQPTGLCEPLTVRLTDGEAWMEVTFDPLTASIADEGYYIP